MPTPSTVPVEERRPLAFDPGARKFNTFYRSDGVHGELLRGAESHILSLCILSDKLRSVADTSDSRTERRSARARSLRTNARLRNFVRNAHYEAIRDCFALGDLMLLPVFGTGRMSRRAERVFGSETARRLYTWSHYLFSQRMWSKVQTTSGKQMAFVGEPGTTRTCDACGAVHPKVKGLKTFECPRCHYVADRDYHGARGNFLAALGAALDRPWDGVER
jgi:putative transposase